MQPMGSVLKRSSTINGKPLKLFHGAMVATGIFPTQRLSTSFIWRAECYPLNMLSPAATRQCPPVDPRRPLPIAHRENTTQLKDMVTLKKDFVFGYNMLAINLYKTSRGILDDLFVVENLEENLNIRKLIVKNKHFAHSPLYIIHSS